MENSKLLVLLALLVVSSVKSYSQEIAGPEIEQHVTSYTTPASDGKLYLFEIKLVWKITDHKLFMSKYSSIDFYKRILDIDVKLAMLSVLGTYDSSEIEEMFFPSKGMKDIKKYIILQNRLIDNVKKAICERNETSILIVSIDLSLVS